MLARYWYLASLAGIHLLLVVLVCVRDTLGIFAKAVTVFPAAMESAWEAGSFISSSALGENLSLQNPIRNAAAVYLNASGIEAGYGFFAPNVPANYKLAFELRFPDGHRQYELPQVADAATAFRFESLLDRIAAMDYEPLRQAVFRMLTYPVWQRHPDANEIRAVLGYTIWPSADQFLKGDRESFDPIYVYQFDLRPSPNETDGSR